MLDDAGAQRWWLWWLLRRRAPQAGGGLLGLPRGRARLVAAVTDAPDGVAR